jgi:hypothetical protein
MANIPCSILQNTGSTGIASLVAKITAYIYLIWQRNLALIAVLNDAHSLLRAIDSKTPVEYRTLSTKLMKVRAQFESELDQAKIRQVRLNYKALKRARELADSIGDYSAILKKDPDNCNFLETRGGQGVHIKQRAKLVASIEAFQNDLSLWSWMERP